MANLFVYGTLMTSVNNNMSRFLQENARFIGNAHIYGRLYEVNGYPGAVSSNNFSECVYGNIFEIKNTEAVFKVLDAYEGIESNNPKGNEYQRKEIAVFLEGGINLRAWFYAYNFPIQSLQRIVSGRYL